MLGKARLGNVGQGEARLGKAMESEAIQNDDKNDIPAKIPDGRPYEHMSPMNSEPRTLQG